MSGRGSAAAFREVGLEHVAGLDEGLMKGETCVQVGRNVSAVLL